MSKNYPDNPINSGEHVRERLSDYMDGALPSGELDAVRSHLEECAECRADYVELRATQKLMQNLPSVPAPRAFTLTPEVAGQVHRPSFWERLFVPRNAPRLATGSVVAFLLLIVVLAGTNGLPSSNSATLTSPLVSTSAGGSEPAAPKAAAAPTSTTAAAGAFDFSGVEPTTTAGPQQPPAPAVIASEPVPGSADSSEAQGTSTDTTDKGTQDGSSASITPNTTVANSASGSPTTTTLSAAPPSEDSVTTHYDRSIASGTADANRSPSTTAADNSRTGWTVLQLGLLALGLALGAAALIAWRRA